MSEYEELVKHTAIVVTKTRAARENYDEARTALQKAEQDETAAWTALRTAQNEQVARELE